MAIVAARMARDDADMDTKWWGGYPRLQFVERARAQETYDNLVGDIWSKSKRTARSASLTNLTYIRDIPLEYPIPRAPSASSLAPSLALPQYYREAQRIVHTEKVYKPHFDDYSKEYSVAKWRNTLRDVEKPYKPSPYLSSDVSTHVPYYTFQTKRVFFDEKHRANRSYLRGSQLYLDKYVVARLKADDFANRFAYSAYEWRKPQDHAFNRHFMYNQGVEHPVATGIPHAFYDKLAMRRMYKLTGRFYF
ncbi:hypothetical protein PFISCL1PPCAC_15102 [Pristionchus fissidentatus]|uniref:Uncharacterized protein n=1 Tax=Pristionchus fissidentatus TaxID=1538716 RepID=A0AAV5W0H6_9BILA|nr:hypothetical protein PFISCL1PPCAC_15102 [Pristionchus fissidentatus]